MTSLNNIFTIHGLLSGFVTVFTGIYNVSTGHLNYVPCGHEPGLIWRADSGTIETLSLGGPPLGVMENADYG